MKMILLAAGKGDRVRPHTDSKPKCLLEVAGKPLLAWQISAARQCGIHDITVVKGYMADRVPEEPGIKYFVNERYETTNMVETLWCAESELKGEVIVSYADILYEKALLQELIRADHDMAVIVDKGWRSYWKMRFSDPVGDAESLRMNKDGTISSIGQKITSIAEPEAQYIGLLKFRGRGLEAMKNLYLKNRERALLGEKPFGLNKAFEKIYMTDFLQGIIDAGNHLHAVPVNRGWLEIDTIADYELAKVLIRPFDSHLQVKA